MKLNYIFLFFIFIFAGCELIPDLERDNPYDKNGTKYENQDTVTTELTYNVVFDHLEEYYYNPFTAGNYATLTIYVKNTGTGTIKNLKGLVSSSSSFIRDLGTPKIYFYTENNYENILPNEIAIGSWSDFPYKNWSFDFHINSDTPSGEMIKFSISLTDELDRQWVEEFEITVQ